MQDGHFPGAAAVAMPGHPAGAPPASIEEAAGFVARLIPRVPGPRVLVGHDLGAAIALEVALAHPEEVEGVVAIAAGATLGTLAALPPDDPDAVVAAAMDEPHEAPARRLADVLRAAGPETLAADLALTAQVDLRGRLASLRPPVLVIAGGEDRLTPPADAERLAAEIPVCHLALVPDARHLVMADAPIAVNLLLAAFLARVELTLDDGA